MTAPARAVSIDEWPKGAMRNLHTGRVNAIEQLHKSYVSATMASIILGVNPWDSPYSLYQRIKGEAPPKEQTLAMRLGSHMERFIVDEFTRETGKKVRTPDRRKKFDPNFWFTTEEYGYPMGALLDGITQYADPDDPRVSLTAVVECKNVSAFLGDEWENEPPIYYYAQMQHQMAVTGWGRVYAVALIGNQLRVMEVERDDNVIAAITDAERNFWLNHVVPGIPPSLDSHKATAEAVKRRYAKSTPGATILIEDPEVERLAQVYVATGQAIDRLKDEREAYGSQIRNLIEDAESVEVGRFRITCKSKAGAKRIDTQRLRADYPEIAAKYTTEGDPSRPLLIKEVAK